MAPDAELDRLKTDQDRAYQRKQDAWQAQDQAWRQRSDAREATDRAYHEKQRAYEGQDASWQDFQRVRSYNGPRIDSLNSQQEAAFENMKSAFDRASSAHESRDGASARMYADEGHGYKAESQAAVAERRQLVQEIRDARDRHEATKPAFQHAKAKFDRVRDEHSRAKADHEQKQTEFKRAKADFDRAKTAFLARLEIVRSERKQRKDDKRSLAERAGVPYQYRDEVYVSTETDGTINIYFGGVGEPNGPGHGHYAMDSRDKVTYRREPFDPHGSQNFTDGGYPRAQGSNWYTKSRSDDGTVHAMYDKQGGITTSYPHVHVIHDSQADQVRVVASWGPGNHSQPTVLPGSASGNEVNAAVDEMRRRL